MKRQPTKCGMSTGNAATACPKSRTRCWRPSSIGRALQAACSCGASCPSRWTRPRCSRDRTAAQDGLRPRRGLPCHRPRGEHDENRLLASQPSYRHDAPSPTCGGHKKTEALRKRGLCQSLRCRCRFYSAIVMLPSDKRFAPCSSIPTTTRRIYRSWRGFGPPAPCDLWPARACGRGPR